MPRAQVDRKEGATAGVVWLVCVIEMVVIVVIMEFWEHRRTRIDSE